VADEIGIMHEGRIQQWDTPYNLYHRPANRFVADFVGQGVFLPGDGAQRKKWRSNWARSPAASRPTARIGCPPAARTAASTCCCAPTTWCTTTPRHPGRSVAKAFRGAEFLYTLRLASGQRVLSLVPSHHNHAIGEKIGIRLDVDHVVVFRNA
jgi:iron(III) transport system ATP-binding protein